jgi:hypothetical protein
MNTIRHQLYFLSDGAVWRGALFLSEASGRVRTSFVSGDFRDELGRRVLSELRDGFPVLMSAEPDHGCNAGGG